MSQPLHHRVISAHLAEVESVLLAYKRGNLPGEPMVPPHPLLPGTPGPAPRGQCKKVSKLFSKCYAFSRFTGLGRSKCRAVCGGKKASGRVSISLSGDQINHDNSIPEVVMHTGNQGFPAPLLSEGVWALRTPARFCKAGEVEWIPGIGLEPMTSRL